MAVQHNARKEDDELMNAKDRDELLIRMDERLKALKDKDKGDIPEIKQQLKELNGCVKTNTIWRKVTIGIGGPSILAIIGILLKLAGIY